MRGFLCKEKKVVFFFLYKEKCGLSVVISATVEAIFAACRADGSCPDICNCSPIGGRLQSVYHRGNWDGGVYWVNVFMGGMGEGLGVSGENCGVEILLCGF